MERTLFKTLLVLGFSIGLIMSLSVSQTATAKRQIEQYNIPQPASYARYELRVEASTRRPEVGESVILKAIISPDINPDKVQYQFLINGSPIAEPGMHKVYTFKETGTYKISAVAKLGGSHLLNSPPIIVHVINSWIRPEAAISPAMLTVKAGQDAVFTSLSETDPESRQWLYWSISSGHRGRGNQFIIKTDKLAPGKYPIELVVKDDRKRESIAHAFLIVSDEEGNVETLSLEKSNTGAIQTDNSEHLDLQLRASHSNRLQNMQVVFWIQNAQPGADTELQLDTGDGTITPWSKKLRYGYRYSSLGVYTAKISARTPNTTQHSNTVTIYVWPLWLPVIMLILGLLLAGIPFFTRHQRQQPTPEPLQYHRNTDPGQHQLILTSDEETAALIIKTNKDKGRQQLTVTETKTDND